jgi:hypothetical protein
MYECLILVTVIFRMIVRIICIVVLWHTGLAGLLGAASVAAAAVRGGVPAHGGAGTSQVRPSGLEHSVRVQSSRLRGERAVRAEPPRRHGPQEGAYTLP